MGEDEVRRVWKEYFEDMLNRDTEERAVVHMCGFGGVGRELFWRRTSREDGRGSEGEKT